MSSAKKIVMLYTGIGMKKTGVIISMIKRANVLASRGHDVTIFTAQYNVELDLVYRDLIDSGMMNADIKFVNMYDLYLRGDVSAVNGNSERYVPTGNDSDRAVHKSNNYIFEDESIKKRYEITRADGTISYINFFTDNKVKFRAKYDTSQRLSCVQTLNQDGSFSSVHFFDSDRKLRVINEYKMVNNTLTVANILLFNDTGTVEGMFSSEQEFFIYTLKQMYNNQDELYYFIIDRAVYFAEVLFKNKSDNYRYIGTVHAAHYVNNLDRMSRVNRYYVEYFNPENNGKLDAVVFLTERQKKHADERFNCNDISVEIPHVYDKPIRESSVERKPYRCISVGRFDVVKRFPEMVAIFGKVIEKCPDAVLEIYGYGPERNNIMDVISGLNLNDKVKLCDYTENIDEIYQSADLMLFTSRSEGYGLVIMESLANGCPVVSYDINYGPSEMIIDGVNGYLIPDNNEHQFAQKVIRLLQDRKKLQRMQGQCRDTARRFSVEDFADRWDTLFNKIENR